jgi:hypothetical protein
MASTWSNYIQAKVLALLFGDTSYSIPGTYYAALLTAAPTNAGGGTEVSGGSYARVAITNNTTNFPAPTGTSPTTSSNGTVITFPTATADWGTCVAMGLYDAATSGNLIVWASLTESKPVDNGDTASWAASALTITLD